jgi:hypothetical protein
MKSDTLKQIDGALARLERGDYGTCFECEDIPEKRLRRLPCAVRTARKHANSRHSTTADHPPVRPSFLISKAKNVCHPVLLVPGYTPQAPERRPNAGGRYHRRLDLIHRAAAGSVHERHQWEHVADWNHTVALTWRRHGVDIAQDL